MSRVFPRVAPDRVGAPAVSIAHGILSGPWRRLELRPRGGHTEKHPIERELVRIADALEGICERLPPLQTRQVRKVRDPGPVSEVDLRRAGLALERLGLGKR